MINSENGVITNGKELIDLETEFLTLGSSVYDYAYLPKELSVEIKIRKSLSSMRFKSIITVNLFQIGTERNFRKHTRRVKKRLLCKQ